MNYKPQTTYYNNKMYYYDLLLMIEWHDTPHVHGKQTFLIETFFTKIIIQFIQSINTDREHAIYFHPVSS